MYELNQHTGAADAVTTCFVMYGSYTVTTAALLHLLKPLEALGESPVSPACRQLGKDPRLCCSSSKQGPPPPTAAKSDRMRLLRLSFEGPSPSRNHAVAGAIRCKV